MTTLCTGGILVANTVTVQSEHLPFPWQGKLGGTLTRIAIGRAEHVGKFNDIPEPDAIFIGGGLTTPDLLETCLTTLCPGGILVANTVTVQSEHMLFQWQGKLGQSAVVKG